MPNLAQRRVPIWMWIAVPGLLAAGCTAEPAEDEVESTEQGLSLSESNHPGRDVWFNNAYHGERFFTFLANHPDPSKRIKIGFEAVLETPRAVRFDVWGVINDPDCVANPGGGMDLCDDPEASGVVGIRKTSARGFMEFGTSCASCHAGFDPKNPPADPNEPEWANIHPSIGNQYLKVGAMFSANLDLTKPTDIVRSLVFGSWPDGTVDTTALFQDNINNPGVITAFWEHKRRNAFDVGTGEAELRNGQGGEDDLGGDIAALRVYTNIGVCFFECVAGPAATGTSIDIDACRQSCPDFPPESDIEDLTDYLRTIDRPVYPGHKSDNQKYKRGSDVFDASCASCHDNTGGLKKVLSNDEMNSLAELGPNATNSCRALSTNWDEGKIWGNFASEVTHQRAVDGTKGYRNMPLGGIWSTSPFLHNQSIGVVAPADATPEERVAAFEASMQELLSATRTPKINTIPFPLGPTIPAGTPLAYIVNRSPTTGALLCGDVVENRGHYFGADLSAADKDALIYFLRFQ